MGGVVNATRVFKVKGGVSILLYPGLVMEAATWPVLLAPIPRLVPLSVTNSRTPYERSEATNHL